MKDFIVETDIDLDKKGANVLEILQKKTQIFFYLNLLTAFTINWDPKDDIYFSKITYPGMSWKAIMG